MMPAISSRSIIGSNTMGFTGQCRCGQVHLQVRADSLPPLYACHCLTCQRWSGSAFALHLLCAAQTVDVTGPTLSFTYTEQGNQSTHHACARCFTRLFNETGAAPSMLVVRAGVLDGAEHLSPLAHIWVTHKQAWLSLPEGVAQWPKSPTPEAFAQAVARAAPLT